MAWGSCQYFDAWNGQFFLHHPFDADVTSQSSSADSFAEIYWEDKIMPYINPTFARESIAKGGTQIADEKIFRCLSDTSRVRPFLDPATGQVNGIEHRTSYLMNSLLSHRSRRYGQWSFPRFQHEIGTSNFIMFNERDAEAILDDPDGDPRQDDYDIWVGTDILDTWIAWKRHGTANCLFLDGHARPVMQVESYKAMFPGGQVLKAPHFYP